MGAKSLIPKSKARTAHGLLSQIRALILEEPKRYNQGTTLEVGHRGKRAPACGTVGCVAGWVCVLKTNWRESHSVCRTARNVLGLSEQQGEELFEATAAGMALAQTLDHAQAGAAHIAAFQKKYAAQLRAKRV